MNTTLIERAMNAHVVVALSRDTIRHRSKCRWMRRIDKSQNENEYAFNELNNKPTMAETTNISIKTISLSSRKVWWDEKSTISAMPNFNFRLIFWIKFRLPIGFFFPSMKQLISSNRKWNKMDWNAMTNSIFNTFFSIWHGIFHLSIERWLAMNFRIERSENKTSSRRK